MPPSGPNNLGGGPGESGGVRQCPVVSGGGVRWSPAAVSSGVWWSLAASSGVRRSPPETLGHRRFPAVISEGLRRSAAVVSEGLRRSSPRVCGGLPRWSAAVSKGLLLVLWRCRWDDGSLFPSNNTWQLQRWVFYHRPPGCLEGVGKLFELLGVRVLPRLLN